MQNEIKRESLSRPLPPDSLQRPLGGNADRVRSRPGFLLIVKQFLQCRGDFLPPAPEQAGGAGRGTPDPRRRIVQMFLDHRPTQIGLLTPQFKRTEKRNRASARYWIRGIGQ